ncbi:MAG: LLM class flavin-dependent oxidoreductase [Xanthobacteraceae bacterium]
MDIGIRLHGGMRPTDCIELAKAAEAAGFASLWFAENPFARGILPVATACAIATERLQIGSGVFNPFSRHPTLMAMEIGAIDELSRGRAALGVGSGIASAMAQIGFNADRPIAALQDTLNIVRGLLRGERVSYAGKAFSARDVKLDFTPRPDIPILLAGRGEMTMKLCGEAADGLILSNMCSVGFAGGAVGAVTASRHRAGIGGAPRVVQYMPCAVRHDRAAAIAAGARAVGAMLPGFWALSQRVVSAKEALLQGTGIGEPEFAAAAQRIKSGEDAARVLDERFVAAFALAGLPDECLAGAVNYAKAGVTELALTFEGPTRLADIALMGEVAACLKSRAAVGAVGGG